MTQKDKGDLYMLFERKGDWLLLKIPFQWEGLSIEALFSQILFKFSNHFQLFYYIKIILLSSIILFIFFNPIF